MVKSSLISALTVGITLATTSAFAAMPYGMAPDAKEAALFAPGIITTQSHFEINAVFNKKGDRVLFARCSDDFKTCTMMSSWFKHGQWQTPTALPFAGGFLEADPYYSVDEKTMYFVSNRPYQAGERKASSVNLWQVSVDGDNWGIPRYMAALSSDANDLYPSVTNNGDLYFPSFRDGKRLLYVAKKTEKGFLAPEALPEAMLGEGAQIGDTVVLADGKTIIFSMRRDDSLGKGDLYVSYKKDGKWTKAKSLGPKVNTADHEFTPIVSPDGRYLFFTRIENGRGNLYQIPLNAVL